MALGCFAQEMLGSSQISSLAEPEFNRVSVAVDCSVKIHPAALDLDIGLVDVPLAGDGSLAAIEQNRRAIRRR